jgi:hypothetical protein
MEHGGIPLPNHGLHLYSCLLLFLCLEQLGNLSLNNLSTRYKQKSHL